MIFLLPIKQIIDVYCVVLSIFILWFSYWFNQNYIVQELSQQENSNESGVLANPESVLLNMVAQVALAFSYNSFRLDSAWISAPQRVQKVVATFQGGTYLCLLQPVIWRLLALSDRHLKKVPLLSVLIMTLELSITVLIQIKSVMWFFKRAYKTICYMLQTHGVQLFFEMQWIRLHVPSVLRVFWITRVAYQVTYLTVLKCLSNAEITDSYHIGLDDVVDISKEVMIVGCETIIALLGMTSVVSYFTHYIGVLMAAFIGSENEEDRNMGTMSAILFFILALQTGLTSLDPDQRLVRLYRNFCLLSTAILHFVHTMVNPMLMNLSASHSGSYLKHARVLSMCLFLVLFPMWFLNYLWMRHSISTWLLAVTAFSVEVIMKVVISLMVYILFIIDAYHDMFWEKLDDYVYYIKATGNTIEFIFGIFLFGNGAWIMVFESGGAIRAAMMVIHAYFNIWVQAKEGWKVFMKRRTAVNKINSLPMATEEQLVDHNDVCAICYQELLTARITRCHHLFHGVCLRKWLYVQDRCPLCHKLIYKPEPREGTQQNEVNGNRPGHQGNQNRNVDDPPANHGNLLNQLGNVIGIPPNNMAVDDQHGHQD